MKVEKSAQQLGLKAEIAKFALMCIHQIKGAHVLLLKQQAYTLNRLYNIHSPDRQKSNCVSIEASKI